MPPFVLRKRYACQLIITEAGHPGNLLDELLGIQVQFRVVQKFIVLFHL